MLNIPDYFNGLRFACLNLFRNKDNRIVVKSLVQKAKSKQYRLKKAIVHRGLSPNRAYGKEKPLIIHEWRA